MNMLTAFAASHTQAHTFSRLPAAGPCIDRSRAGLDLPRYKHIVQVVIGEMKGAGVRCGCAAPRAEDRSRRWLTCGRPRSMGARCLWDAQTDKMAQETFVNVCPRRF